MKPWEKMLSQLAEELIYETEMELGRCSMCPRWYHLLGLA